VSLLFRCFADTRHILAAVVLALVFSPSAAAAQSPPPPIVTITPRGKLVTASNRNITVTVRFCQPWGGLAIQSRHFTLSANDVSSFFTYQTNGQDAICDYWEDWTGTITLATWPQMQEFKAWAVDPLNTIGQDIVNYAVPAPGRGVLVASAAGLVTVLPSSSNSAEFTVWNRGDVGATYSLTSTCSAAASSCSLGSSTVYVPSGNSQNVTVSYNSSGTPNDTGLVKVKATDQDDAGIQSESWTEIKVKSGLPAGITLTREMDQPEQCVIANLAPDVAMRCGDLRVSHALPSVRTLGRTRTPTLVYNARFARPRAVVMADFTVPDGPTPSYVRFRAYINGTQMGYYEYGSDWNGGKTRAMSLLMDLWNLTPNTIHGVDLEVQQIGGSGTT
jgi:hypothetical protein